MHGFEAPLVLLNKVLKTWKSHPDLNACQGSFSLIFEQCFKSACWFSWVNESLFILLCFHLLAQYYIFSIQSSAKKQTKRQILKECIKSNPTWIFTDINLINCSFKQKIKKVSCSSLMWVNFYVALVTGKAFIPSGLQLLFPVSPVLGETRASFRKKASALWGWLLHPVHFRTISFVEGSAVFWILLHLWYPSEALVIILLVSSWILDWPLNTCLSSNNFTWKCSSHLGAF